MNSEKTTCGPGLLQRLVSPNAPLLGAFPDVQYTAVFLGAGNFSRPLLSGLPRADLQGLPFQGVDAECFLASFVLQVDRLRLLLGIHLKRALLVHGLPGL